MKTRISVVMTTFNGAKFVAAQLESLLAVLAENDEIVISDDGSSDNTRDIIAAIAEDRIRLLPAGPRLGYQANFARAVRAASGAYIFFSDQDDICLPARIPESLQALARRQCVFGDAVVVNDALATTTASYHAYRQTGALTAWHVFAYPPAIGATMACTKQFIELAMPFPGGVPHDHWMTLLAAMLGELDFVPRPFILYRRHGAAVSSTGATSVRPMQRILTERARLATWACGRLLARGRLRQSLKAVARQLAT